MKTYSLIFQNLGFEMDQILSVTVLLLQWN